MTDKILISIARFLEEGEVAGVEQEVRKALDEDLTPKVILEDGLLAGMDVIGRQFKNYEIFLPDVLLAAKAMHAGMGILRPLLEQDAVAGKGNIILGTVEGDQHDIGKNLVAILLRGAGYHVVDLGTNVGAGAFIESAMKYESPIIGLSALLTTTMPAMREVIKAIEAKGLRERFKVMVGGAPVSEAYTEQIGADAYACDAQQAVEVVSSLLAKD